MVKRASASGVKTVAHPNISGMKKVVKKLFDIAVWRIYYVLA